MRAGTTLYAVTTERKKETNLFPVKITGSSTQQDDVTIWSSIQRHRVVKCTCILDPNHLPQQAMHSITRGKRSRMGTAS